MDARQGGGWKRPYVPMAGAADELPDPSGLELVFTVNGEERAQVH